VSFRLSFLWAERPPLCDLAKVIHRKDDSVAVEMERNLLPVGAGPERALCHLNKTDAAQDLGRLRRREDA